MFRSFISSAFSSSINPNKHPSLAKCRSGIASFYPHKGRSFRAPSGGSWIVGDVLRILGPIDHSFSSSDANAYVRLLRRCIRTKNSPVGMVLHALTIKSGFDSEVLLSNALLGMYSKTGLFECALKLFDEIPEWDMISWCTLISGFVAHGLCAEAFRMLRRMRASGLNPNGFVLSSVMKGCSSSEFLDMGIAVHGLIVKAGPIFDRFIEIGLVAMYAKCGCLDDALKAFYEIPVKSLVSWNAMISGYLQNGLFVETIELCKEMFVVGFVMDAVTLRVVARAASALGILEVCSNFHAHSIKMGLDGDTFFVVELIRLLAKLGEVSYMKKLFDGVNGPDASLYSLLISGYHLHGHRSDAIKLAQEFLALDLDVNHGAFVSVLKLCICKDEGEQIHGHIIKTGHASCIFAGNSLITMYIRCEAMRDAATVFLNLPIRDVVSWTALMAGCVMNSEFLHALGYFSAFRETGLELDSCILLISINACAGVGAIELGEQIHSFSVKLGVDSSSFVSASLLYLYAKCGHIEDSARLFYRMAFPHDLIFTNIMIAGFCWNWQPEKAIELFTMERRSGLLPDRFTFTTILGACADLKSMTISEQIHCQIAKYGLEYSDVVIGNAIAKMYAKAGNIFCACKFLYSMRIWSASTYWMMLEFVQERTNVEFQMQPSLSLYNSVFFARILRGSDMLSRNQRQDEMASAVNIGLASDAHEGSIPVQSRGKCSNKEKEMFGVILPREDKLYASMISEYSHAVEEERILEVDQLFGLVGGKYNYNSYIDSLKLNAAVGSWTSFHTIQGTLKRACSAP